MNLRAQALRDGDRVVGRSGIEHDYPVDQGATLVRQRAMQRSSLRTISTAAISMALRVTRATFTLGASADAVAPCVKAHHG